MALEHRAFREVQDKQRRTDISFDDFGACGFLLGIEARYQMEKWKIILVGTILLLLLCGCGVAEDSAQNMETQQEELVLWSYYETEDQQKGLDQLIEKFNHSQENYHLSWEYVPMADFVKRLSIALTSDSMPDLVLVDNPDMKSLVNMDVFEDITDKLPDNVDENEYYDEVWHSVVYHERCYGVPFCCNNTAIIYNKSMFEEAGVQLPKTWEEFREAAKMLTNSEHAGFGISAIKGEQGAFQFTPWILSTGTKLDDMTDIQGKKAFRFFCEMIKDGSIPNDCMNWSQVDLTRKFLSKDVAMIENGPWSLPAIEESGIDYGIIPFPKDTDAGVIVGGENLGVIKDKNVDGALDFIRFYCDTEIMMETSEIMMSIPPRRKEATVFGENNETYQVFVEQMEDGISRTSVDNWKTICTALNTALYEMFGEDMDVEKIWKNYVEIIEES